MTSAAIPIDFTLEESTINSKSPLPSFVEIILLDKAYESGRKVLESIIEAISSHAVQYLRTEDGNGVDLGFIRKVKSLFVLVISRLCHQYKLETQLILTYLIEKNVMNSTNGTIAESLFGLTRSSMTSDRYIKSIKQADVIKGALLVGIVPYIGGKAKQLHDKERDNIANDNISDARSSRIVRNLRSILVETYPYLHFSAEGVKTAYYFAYAIGKTCYFSPSMHILGQVVRRRTLSDLKPNSNTVGDQSQKQELSSSGSSSFIKTCAATSVLIALSIGWILQLRREIRMRRRNNIDENDSRSRQNLHAQMNEGVRLSKIPAPLAPSVNAQFDSSVCPLCRQSRVNPVATIQGIVYCYKCVVLHMKENGDKCPVTGGQCSSSQLIRIYESIGRENPRRSSR